MFGVFWEMKTLDRENAKQTFKKISTVDMRQTNLHFVSDDNNEQMSMQCYCVKFIGKIWTLMNFCVCLMPIMPSAYKLSAARETRHILMNTQLTLAIMFRSNSKKKYSKTLLTFVTN